MFKKSDSVTLKMSTGLLTDVHDGLQIDSFSKNCYLVRGSYEYYHYLCDGFNDRVRLYLLYIGILYPLKIYSCFYKALRF